MEFEILTQDGTESNLEYFESLFFNLHGRDIEFVKVDSLGADKIKIISLDSFNNLNDKRKISRICLFILFRTTAFLEIFIPTLIPINNWLTKVEGSSFLGK